MAKVMSGTLKRIDLTDTVNILTLVVMFMRAIGKIANGADKAVKLVPNLFSQETFRMINNTEKGIRCLKMELSTGAITKMGN